MDCIDCIIYSHIKIKVQVTVNRVTNFILYCCRHAKASQLILKTEICSFHEPWLLF